MRAYDKNLTKVMAVVKLQIFIAIAWVLCVVIVAHNLNTISSSVLGALIAIIPTYIYVKFAFKDGVVVAPIRALRNHKMAILVRFILNLSLFLLVCLFYQRCNFLALLGAFFVVLSAYWLSLLKA